MQISEIIYFFLILHLILGKVSKLLVEKTSTSEVVSQKPLGGGGGGGVAPLSALGVKDGATFYEDAKNLQLFCYQRCHCK